MSSSRSKESSKASSTKSSSSKSSSSKEKEKQKDEEVRKSKVDSTKEKEKEKEKIKIDKEKSERDKREREKEKEKEKPKEKSRSEKEDDRVLKDKEKEREKEKERDKKKSKDYIEEEIYYENEKDKNRDRYEGKKNTKIIEEVVESEEETQYDDDFEDYEEDFEEEEDEDETAKTQKEKGNDNDNEMSEVIKAINNENAKAIDHRIEKPTQNTTHSVPVRQVVDLSKPNLNSQKQAKTQQQFLRARELSQLITLEPVLVDLIDLPPLSEYELYIRSFGGKDTVQVHTQTHEDDTEKEVQTTEIKLKSKSVQFPVSESTETQVEENESLSDDEQDTESINENNSTHIFLPKVSLDAIRLSKFLQNASLVIESLLDENTSEKGFGGRSKTFISEPTGNWSTSNLKMQPWKGRGAKQIIFMHGGPPYKMLVVYGDKLNGNDSNAGSIEGKGLLCIWSLENQENPSKILVLEGKPSYASISPYSKPYGIFVGTQEGELSCWDLRESDTMHNIKLGTHSVRYPTFSTHANKKESHQAPIVCLVTLPKKNSPENNENEIPTNLKNNEVAEKKLIKKTHGNPLDLLPLGDEDEGSSFPFQIASMDEQGTINIWVVVELSNTQTTSEFDLGLSIGGRMKLVKSASIPLLPTTNNIKSQTRFSPTIKSFDLKFNPVDPNEYFVGTDSGNIMHGFRFGNLAYPRNYQSPSILKSAINVVCLSISPFNPEYFLVGLNTGHICLYNYKTPDPISFWETFSHSSIASQPPSIINIQWSPVRSAMFFAQNSDSTLFIFDLLSDSKGPIITETWNKTQKNYTNFDFEYHPSFAVSEAQRSKGKKMDQFLATSFNDGHIEIHILHSQFSNFVEGEDARLKKYLLSL